jgi:hypothetical protein
MDVSFLDAEIRRSAEQDTFTVHAFSCSTTFSFCTFGVPEQRVSGTRYRTRWAKSSAAYCPYLSPLQFYLWGRLEFVYAAEEEE